MEYPCFHHTQASRRRWIHFQGQDRVAPHYQHGLRAFTNHFWILMSHLNLLFKDWCQFDQKYFCGKIFINFKLWLLLFQRSEIHQILCSQHSCRSFSGSSRSFYLSLRQQVPFLKNINFGDYLERTRKIHWHFFGDRGFLGPNRDYFHLQYF